MTFCIIVTVGCSIMMTFPASAPDSTAFPIALIALSVFITPLHYATPWLVRILSCKFSTSEMIIFNFSCYFLTFHRQCRSFYTLFWQLPQLLSAFWMILLIKSSWMRRPMLLNMISQMVRKQNPQKKLLKSNFKFHTAWQPFLGQAFFS